VGFVSSAILREVSKPSIAVIGPGALGSSLALALHRHGFRIVEVVTRDTRRSATRKLARKVKAKISSTEHAELKADIVWICVPDDAIAPLASSLRSRNWKGKVVLHASGALSANILQALRAKRAAIASAHPMMSFVRSTQTNFKDVWFALEGDRRAVFAARKLISALGAKSITIRPDLKPLYHLFGGFLSPFLVTVLSAAEQIGRKAGVPSSQLPQIMRPIVMRTLENYFSKGATASFSGPLVRGDVETIRKHVRAVRKLPERELYRALVLEATRTLPVKRAEEILAIIK
jgi:predicted short-subunit dehydrogenase-like oxidoreductase (DUF2520 family)